MDGPAPTYRVNELTPDPAVTFNSKVVRDYVTYAHRLANRGLVNSSVGGMVDPGASCELPGRRLLCQAARRQP